jgi:hypothetical protein
MPMVAMAATASPQGTLGQGGGDRPVHVCRDRLGRKEESMPRQKRERPLRIGDRARSKLNRRVGTVDGVNTVGERRQYGLHYDEAPQDRYLAMTGHDGAQLPPELIERE